MADPPAAQSPPRLLWAPPLVAAGVLVLTVFAVAIVARDNTAKARERFRRAVELTQAAVESRMETHVALLRGIAALFVSSDEVTWEEFQAYAGQLRMTRRLPGAVGIGWSQRVQPAEREQFELTARLQGLSGFHIWPEGTRAEYHTIRYLEPFDLRNQAAIGYDMHTEPVRRAAMDRARDHARPAVSGAVTLVQDAVGRDQQPGFLLYLPVYQGGVEPRNVGERRALLAGFVYSAFRASELFESIMQREPRQPLDVEVYDGSQPVAGRLLYRTRDDRAGRRPLPRLSTITRLRVGGRTWTMVVSTQPEFDAALGSKAPALLLATGLGVALLLFAVIRAQTEARLRAERATLELRRSEEALREAGRAKDEFLATLSHELRTPLGNVLMWSQLLRTRRDDPSTTARALETIERNARMLGRLIDDLLDVSRIVSGKLSLAMRPTELNGLVHAAIEAVQPSALAKRVALKFEDDGTPRWVSGDPARLQQVVANLVSNAIKFTAEGGSVTVRLDVLRGRARLTVVDTGCGIASDILPHVFERFRQADSRSTRAHGGLGLGLAIVRHLVERHGGTVAAQSEGPGRGSTFCVFLPLLAREGAPMPAPVLAGPTQPGRPLAGIRVLVVDDEPDAREAIAAVLAAAGAGVRTAGSAGHAFELFEREVPDVVLSDIAMPGEDGYGLLQRLRALPAERGGTVPAAALTAYATIDDRRKALQAGFQAHLPKPLEGAILVATVLELSRAAPVVAAEASSGG